MSNRNKFRLLFLFQFLLAMSSSALVYFLDEGELDAAYEKLPHGYDYMQVFDSYLGMAVLIAIVILGIASFIGILLFKNWARWLNVIGVCLLIPMTTIFGPTIYHGWEAAIWDFSNVIYGVVIAMMFLPPISNEFGS